LRDCKIFSCFAGRIRKGDTKTKPFHGSAVKRAKRGRGAKKNRKTTPKPLSKTKLACCASVKRERGAKNKPPKAKNQKTEKGKRTDQKRAEKPPPQTNPNKPLQHPLKNRTDEGFRFISLFISFSVLGSLSPFL
jgi:hypothetical protein